MKLTEHEILDIRYCGCYYMGLGNGCRSCPFKLSLEKYGVKECGQLRNYPRAVVEIASDAYRNDKKFARIFDKRCGQYKSALMLKAVVL